MDQFFEFAPGQRVKHETGVTGIVKFATVDREGRTSYWVEYLNATGEVKEVCGNAASFSPALAP